MKKLRWIVFILLGVTQASYAWNQLGHKLVAQIAYHYLTPHTKQVLTPYLQAAANVYGPRSWVNIGPWLDSFRDINQPDLRLMHYINIPFSRDNTVLRAPKPMNVVVAIENAKTVLKNPNASLVNKGFNLRVLIHLVGDIHQPLHAVTEYSRRLPRGDLGGNLFYLKRNPYGFNLHSYWDNGGGLLKPRKRYSASLINKKAHQLEQRYPCHPDSINLEPAAWAQESFVIAKEKAYQIKLKEKPSREYSTMVKQLSEQRIALAGCRLAGLLNNIIS